ncbi:MAG: amidohydrolase [Peptostreptococcaceae bacterium]|nr:amidohydrolase [Peptostreptococcaceae bacterium]
MLIIKNAIVHTMARGVLEDAHVLVRDGKISEIIVQDSAIDDRNADFEGIVIDAHRKHLYPGFIDAHSHLGMWEDSIGFEGSDGNESVDPVTPHLRAIDGINPMDRTFEEARAGGITATATGPGSANVIGGQFAVIKTWGVCIDDMILKAPCAMKCALGENPKRTYNDREESPVTRMATAAMMRESFIKAKDYVEKKKLAETDEDAEKPDFDFKMEALVEVVEKKIPIKVHAHRADDILTAIRIAKEFDLDMTIEHCTEGHLIVEQLKRENYAPIVGPSLSERSKFELKNLTFKTPGILSNAGIKIAIMTDHPVIPIQYLPLCASLAVKAGMDRKEAMKAITINAAEIIGVGDRIGSIEEGKDADLVLWDRDPFDAHSEVLWTMIDGEIVYKR